MKRDFALPRRLWAMVAAATLVLGMTGFIASSQAVVGNPFDIDGTVPDVGDNIFEFDDPNGNAQELGPAQGNNTKLGVIHTAAVPMLATTNPNGQTDLNTIWLGSEVDDADDVWLYLAWERDSNRGTGVIQYEFMQSPAPAGCDYSLPQADLVAGCNPYANRQPGDFILVWDQQGNTINIILRTWGYTDSNGNGEWDGPLAEPLVLSAGTTLANNDDAFATTGSNGFRGEAAVNLSDTIFELAPDQCITIGNVIPGTVTGNSDTADYKDVVLADVTDQVSISSCGLLTVTKEVTALEDSTDLFDFTVARGGAVLDEDGNTALTYDDELAIGIPWESPDGLFAGAGYTLTEDDLSAAWTLESIICTTGDGDPVDLTAGGTFSIEQSVTTDCVITNSPSQGTLVVTKTVVNDNGGLAEADDFAFTVDGADPIPFEADGSNSLTVDAGTYAVVETDDLSASYSASYSTTDGAEGSTDCDEVVVPAGGTATCAVTNDDRPGTLVVDKELVQDNGGTETAEDFSYTVNGGDAVAFEADGSNSQQVDRGSYTVAELEAAGYTTTYDNCTDVFVDNGGTATCTITNNDQPATLIVNKTLVNDNGGTKAVTDFSYTVNGGAAVPFEGDGSNTQAVDAGTYSVVEVEADQDGYATTYAGCSDIVLGIGETATCTITNDDVAGTLIVEKVLTNDNGGTKVVTDFSYTVNGGTAVPFEEDGTNSQDVAAGSYTVVEVEADQDGYTTAYDNCEDVVIANGATETCTITNNDTKASPDGSTVQDWVIHDTLTLTGLRAGGVGEGDDPATVTFRLYDYDAVAESCSAEPIAEGEVIDLPLDGTTASTETGVAVTEAGYYSWRVTYSGDQFNEGFTTDCGEEVTLIDARDAFEGGRDLGDVAV
jgi:hypothetical protein